MSIRSLRLVTGLIIFTFVVCHLINLSLGLISLAVMEAARPLILWVWQTAVGGIILLASVMVHAVLGFIALYRRRTLRLTRFDAVQLLSALLLPPLLIAHLLSTGIAAQVINASPDYRSVLQVFWLQNPLAGLRQVTVIVFVWIHGCMGVYYWARLQGWWPRISFMIYPAAFIIPVLALLGFVQAGKTVIQENVRSDAYAGNPSYEAGGYARPAARATADSSDYAGNYGANIGNAVKTDREAELQKYKEDAKVIEQRFIIGYLLVLLMVFFARWLRIRKLPDESRAQVLYTHGPVVDNKPGLSILEISRLNGIPHTNLCGGRARCGTCRVRVLAGLEKLSPASDQEAATLQRLNAATDIRLACQIVPDNHSVTVERLVAGDWRPGGLVRDWSSGIRKEVVILRIKAIDPEDIIDNLAPPQALSLVDEYLSAARDVIEDNAGIVTRSDERGYMALYGLEQSTETSIFRALKTLSEISSAYQHLNVRLDLDPGMEQGVSFVLHFGKVVIGAPGESKLTALGRSIDECDHLADQLQPLAINEVIVTESLLNETAWDLDDLDVRQLEAGDRWSSRAWHLPNAGDLVQMALVRGINHAA